MVRHNDKKGLLCGSHVFLKVTNTVQEHYLRHKCQTKEEFEDYQIGGNTLRRESLGSVISEVIRRERGVLRGSDGPLRQLLNEKAQLWRIAPVTFMNESPFAGESAQISCIGSLHTNTD